MKFETFRNGISNLLGGALPALATLLSTPFVVNSLGETNYGVLILITSIIGYFAIIDLNITAGSVKYISEHHAKGNIRLRNQTLTSGLAFYLFIGLAGACLISIFSNALVIRVFAVPEKMQQTARSTLQLAAVGFLFSQIQIYLNSVPQAVRRYDKTATIEAAFGVLTPLSTVLVIWLGHGIFEVVLVRVIASILNIIVLAIAICRLIPDVAFETPTKATLTKLGRFSSFAYLNRMAAIAYAQGDKLILGAFASMNALTYYAVPFMLVNRVFSLSYRLGSVIFPAASALAANKELDRLRELYLFSARYIFFINCGLAAILSSLGNEILLYWIGPNLTGTAALILMLITASSLIDSLTNAPSLVNDGLGKPTITGTFAMSRALLGVSLTLLAVRTFGVLGAAFAQVVTSTLMAAIFVIYVHGRSVPVPLSDFYQIVIKPSLPALLFAAILTSLLRLHSPLSMPLTLCLLAGESVLIALFGYLCILRDADRKALLQRIRPFVNRT